MDEFQILKFWQIDQITVLDQNIKYINVPHNNYG